MNNEMLHSNEAQSLVESLADSLHGGDIVSAAQQYGVDIDQWIDLSTGLNPDSYPIDNIPSAVYQRLPYLQPEFMRASARYYQSSDSIALIGSQMLIQCLPQCVMQAPVLVPDVGYNEHRSSWQRANFTINDYPAFDEALAVKCIDKALHANPKQHLVVINPNNPSGLILSPEQLIKWAAQIDKDCYVIVDEAFIDMQPNRSVLSQQWPNNMLVLRSFGKFFGLAGIRIGFAFCKGVLKERVEKALGLWMINGPAQYIATQAMNDTAWQHLAITEINNTAKATQQLFSPLLNMLMKPMDQEEQWQCHQPLFSSYQLPLAVALRVQDEFAQGGILLRVISLANKPQYALLRIGILSVKNKQQQQRVKEKISRCCEIL